MQGVSTTLITTAKALTTVMEQLKDLQGQAPESIASTIKDCQDRVDQVRYATPADPQPGARKTAAC